MNSYQTYKFIAASLALEYPGVQQQLVTDPIANNAVNWKKFFEIASNHLVLQTLYRIYETQEISLPPEVSQELKHIYDLNQERNQQILKAALEINSMLQAINIIPVFTKGVSHLMNDLYQDPAERIMADIDLLIKAEEIAAAVEELEKHGYVAPIKLSTEVKHIYRKHHPRLHKPGMPAFIEIHWEAVRSPYSKNFTYTEIFKRKQTSKLYPECYTMSANDSAIHHFIHSQLEHGGHRYARVFLRNLYDLLSLSKRCDLQEAFESFGHYKKRSASFLRLTESVFKVPLSKSEKHIRSSKFYLLRHQMNIRYVSLNFIFELINRFYRSYILKFFLIITKKEVRNLTANNLSDRDWYKQHFNSYQKIFGSRQRKNEVE